MSDTTTSTPDVTIEAAGPARKRLTITVPPEAVTEKIEESMATLSTETSLPGFRKGRAPRQLLSRRFGTAVRNEAKNQLIADAYATAIEEHDLKPVGEPEPEGDFAELELEDGKPLTFTLAVEVVPDFDLPKYEGLAIHKPVVEVTDEHIDTELDRQRVQFGEIQRVDGPVTGGDRLQGPATVTREGADEPVFTHDAVEIVVPPADGDGSGTVLGLLIDDLAKRLKGVSTGDTLTIETIGPATHENEEIRDAPLTIEFHTNQAVRIEPAELQTVLDHYGMDSADILREQIRLALETRRDQEVAAAMRDQVCDQLLDAVDFELPERLTSGQAARILQQHEVELLYRGLTREEVDRRLAESRAESVELARRRLKLQFLVHRLAREFQIQVSEQEINGRIASLAAQRGTRPEQLRNELAQSGRLDLVAGQIRDHKTLDRVVAAATATEIPNEQWIEMVAERQREAAGRKKKTTTKKKTAKKTTSAGAQGTKKKTTKKKPTTKKKKAT
ncbi:MAG: trigger factor [Planctomycetota bacterium]|jgi:trigger factor